MLLTSALTKLSLHDLDPSSTTGVQKAAENIRKQLVEAASTTKAMKTSNYLSDLLLHDTGLCVLKAVVQSQWRYIPDNAKQTYRDQLFTLLFAEETSSSQVRQLCQCLLHLMRQDPKLILRLETVSQIKLFYDKAAKGWSTDMAVPKSLDTALQVTHVLSKHYEFAEMEFSDALPDILEHLLHTLARPIVKHLLLPVM